MTNDTAGPWNYPLHDMEGVVVSEAVVQVMGEGDLIVGLRPAGAHRDNETAIVDVEGRKDGSVRIKILTGQGDLLHEQVVEPRPPRWSTEVFDSAGTLAIKKDGIDVLHAHVVTPDAEFTKVTLSEGEHQAVIDAIDAAITNMNEAS